MTTVQPKLEERGPLPCLGNTTVDLVLKALKVKS